MRRIAVRIQSATIRNFRGIDTLKVEFDNVTTLLGPNGAGKSTILRALDWFFNGDKGRFADADINQHAGESDLVQVSVTFADLTVRDREILTRKYAPESAETFTAWRSWNGQDDKFTGKGVAFASFENVRSAVSAADKKAALQEVGRQYPDLDIPKWTNQTNTFTAMDEWEANHPEFLSDADVSDTHFFGFQGGGRLSGVFDYVFVPADLRAEEEVSDSRSSVVGRILALAVDREGASAEIDQLKSRYSRDVEEIIERTLRGQLSGLATSATEAITAFAPGYELKLSAVTPDLKVPALSVAAEFGDGKTFTSVDRQGHGLQRTLLIAASKLLAEQGSKAITDHSMVLAIEEPELFQHPTQARVFARVLRAMASGTDAQVQVAYATHSPYFIEPRYFDQIRLVRRRGPSKTISVSTASLESVSLRLAGHVAQSALVSRWDQVCLKNLPDAFFAETVVLVEGDHDKAIIEGAAHRDRPLEYDGIVVSSAQGKGKLSVPHAILAELSIPTLCVFDNDSGCGDRMRQDGKDEEKIEQAERSVRRENRELCRYLEIPEEDYPSGIVSDTVCVTPDTIESVVNVEWPDWAATRDKIIDDGRGTGGKNAATYLLASEECATDPPGFIRDLVVAARQLCEAVTESTLGSSQPGTSMPTRNAADIGAPR
ncbi:ATP-dependent nuclease [Pseudonocardia endophytica]|uniref:ATP-dependent nuclease n=1 Tax=Pseudonocardia endophytica TaxID=401976 RepID=UPI0014050641|nr:AAA family ATPase [Pseudonocardia endophytica]